MRHVQRKQKRNFIKNKKKLKPNKTYNNKRHDNKNNTRDCEYFFSFLLLYACEYVYWCVCLVVVFDAISIVIPVDSPVFIWFHRFQLIEVVFENFI